MDYLLFTRAIISIGVGILAGWGSVAFFNKIPAKWLCDYDEEPDERVWGLRIKKYPWSPVFAILFIWILFFMWYRNPLYQLVAVISLWFLLLIFLADLKFMIIPDQFTMAIAITAIGYIPFQTDLLSPLLGAAIGGGSFLFIGFTGKLIFKKEAMGFGDVKLFAAIGLMAGMKGVIIIIFLTIMSAGIVMGIGLLIGKLQRGDHQPLAPFITASAGAFILFRPWLLMALHWYLGQFK